VRLESNAQTDEAARRPQKAVAMALALWRNPRRSPATAAACNVILAAAARISSKPVHAVRFNQRFYDLKNGKMLWLPLDPSAQRPSIPRRARSA
jgi:hypothetical protein